MNIARVLVFLAYDVHTHAEYVDMDVGIGVKTLHFWKSNIHMIIQTSSLKHFYINETVIIYIYLWHYLYLKVRKSKELNNKRQ